MILLQKGTAMTNGGGGKGHDPKIAPIQEDKRTKPKDGTKK